MLKRTFTKDQLLVMKKYNQLLAYNIPYILLNRGYNRYLKNIGDFILKQRYPPYWFPKDRKSFCYAVKLYIEAQKEKYDYRPGTTGYTKIEMVKVSGLNKYL
jgi:hypothetical protein